VDLRILRGERPQDGDEDRRVGRPRDTDCQLTHLPAGHAGGQVRRMGRLRQDDARFLYEHPAGFGELHLALRPVEQLHLQLVLQLAHLVAQGRLAQVKPLCGPPEVQRLGERDDIAEVAQFHAAIYTSRG
jgi:hypothetical protein